MSALRAARTRPSAGTPTATPPASIAPNVAIWSTPRASPLTTGHVALDRTLRGEASDVERVLARVARSDDPESGAIEPLDGTGDEQERRAGRAEALAQSLRESIVERREQRDAGVEQPFLLEAYGRRRVEQGAQPARFGGTEAGQLGDDCGVPVEQIAGIDALHELPELAGGQRFGVDGHQPVGQQERRAHAVGRIGHQSRPADEAKATG